MGAGDIQFLFDCDVLQREGMPYYNQAEADGDSVGVGVQYTEYSIRYNFPFTVFTNYTICTVQCLYTNGVTLLMLIVGPAVESFQQ